MKVLISASGTIERIDNVRAIRNMSSGKLGLALCKTFQDNVEDIEIFYICNNDVEKPKLKNGKVIEINNVSDLEKEMINILINNEIDIVVHSMAVSDYSVNQVTSFELLSKSIVASLKEKNIMITDDSIDDIVYNALINNKNTIDNSNKVNSDFDDLVVVLNKTKKIISLIKKYSPNSILVGFKLLDSVSTDYLLDVAYKLLRDNNCDFVLANDLALIDETKHIGYLIDEDKNYVTYKNKEDISKGILQHCLNKIERCLENE